MVLEKYLKILETDYYYLDICFRYSLETLCSLVKKRKKEEVVYYVSAL